MNSQVPVEFQDAKTGQKVNQKYFRIQLKILDPSITSLDTAVVYLFDAKKQLVGTLKNIGAEATLTGTSVQENVLNYPNMISSLSGLEKNRSYNLIFMYTQNEISFKYAVAVVGTQDQVVADILPSSAKIDEFEFDGKDKLVQ